jgi:hypothetical protein
MILGDKPIIFEVVLSHRLSNLHTLDPPINISLSDESGIQLHQPPSKKITKGPQIGHSYLMQTYLGPEGCGGVLIRHIHRHRY